MISLPYRAAASLAFLAVLGCDNSFVPIEVSDRRFSVFGHLNASADTQWIRVMPTRSVISTSPDPLGVNVTLENVQSGRTVVLRDSMFEYPYIQETGAQGVFVHNYWTTEKIEPGATYRFTATGPTLGSTTATVPIPPDFSLSVGVSQASLNAVDELRITGAEYIAFVKVIVYFRDGCGQGIQVLNQAVPRGKADTHVIQIRKITPTRSPPAPCGPVPITAEKREILIVGSGSPWPTGQQFTSGALEIPELPTNLTNAIGFLGGVLTKQVPYEECTVVGAEPLPTFCELTYGSEKAMLIGTINDRCLNRRLFDAVIRLEPILPDATGRKKVRTALSALTGAYRIGGLDPGVRYAVNVSHPETILNEGDTRTYLAYNDTLQFTPGQQATLDVGLQRRFPC